MSLVQAHCPIPVCKIFEYTACSLHIQCVCVCVCAYGGNLRWLMRLVLRMERVVFSQELSSALRVLTSALNSFLLTHCRLPLPVNIGETSVAVRKPLNTCTNLFRSET